MKPKILLTGKTGQIGSELLRLLPRLGEVTAPDHRELDLLDPMSIRRVVREVRPQVIVNTAAFTAVDAAETEETKARAINAEAPCLFAEEAKKLGAAIVHFSTDYVFDGLKRVPYDETDAPNPLNAYGRTKFEGEQAIRDTDVNHLILRTAWVYSTRNRNFLLTILRLATEQDELRVVCDQFGAPTCATDIAAATAEILTGIYGPSSKSRSISEISGTYHMTAAGETTWYAFARTILEEATHISQGASWFASATQGNSVIARRVIPISADLYRSRTVRPTYSVLSNSLMLQTFGIELGDWRCQFLRCLSSEQRDHEFEIPQKSSTSFDLPPRLL